MIKTKKKNIVDLFIIVMAVVSAVIIFIEGYFYYYPEINQTKLSIILASLFNVIKSFLTTSKVGFEELTNQLNSTDNKAVFIGYSYLFSRVIAPFVTVISVKDIYILLRKWMYTINFNITSFSKERIAIFGSFKTKQILDLVKSSNLKYNIMIVCNQDIENSDYIELLRLGARVYNCDLLEDNNNLPSLFKKRLLKSNNIVFLDSRPAQNTYLIDAVTKLINSENNTCLKKNKKYQYYINCEDESAKQLLIKHLDSNYRWLKQNENEFIGHLNYKNLVKPYIFDLNYLQIQEMFECDKNENTRLYYYNRIIASTMDKPYKYASDQNNPWNVRVVLAGFGQLGRAAAHYIINNGVFHSKASITIEVFDKDINSTKGIFMKSIREYRVLNDEQSILLGNDEKRLDGHTQINFYNLDLRTASFEKKINEIQASSQITYFSICLNDESLCLDCISSIQRALLSSKDTNTKYIPIVAFLSADEISSISCYRDPESYNLQILSKNYLEFTFRKHLVSKESDLLAKRFNYLYNSLYETKKHNWDIYKADMDINKIDYAWYSATVNDRLSTIAQSQHQLINKMLLEQYSSNDYSSFLNELVSFLEIKLTNYDKIKNDSSASFDDVYFVNKINDSNAEENTRILREFAMLEHRRWNQFHLINGWKYSEKTNKERYEHNCLLTWDDLCENPHTVEKCIYDLYPLLILYNQDLLINKHNS